MLIKNDIIKNNSEIWEQRSIDYGSTLKSVLFQGMPDIANEHFHAIHLKFILDCLDGEKNPIKILDIGCGYGRLSMPLIKRFPQAQIVGMDISSNYVKLYREKTGKEAYAGSIDAIPAESGNFDYIIVITVLMYLADNKLKEVFSGLFSHLNPGGKIIIIEPLKSGIKFQTCFGLTKLLKRETRINTGGKCFFKDEIPAAIDQAGGFVIREECIPATTFFFILIYLASKILPKALTDVFLRWLSFIDSKLKNKKLPSLWSFYLVEKKSS
ncbi:MAG: class I SAM-dependent methyltransferase [Smithella sp.]